MKSNEHSHLYTVSNTIAIIAIPSNAVCIGAILAFSHVPRHRKQELGELQILESQEKCIAALFKRRGTHVHSASPSKIRLAMRFFVSAHLCKDHQNDRSWRICQHSFPLLLEISNNVETFLAFLGILWPKVTLDYVVHAFQAAGEALRTDDAWCTERSFRLRFDGEH